MLKLFPRLITLIITVAAHLTAYYQFPTEIGSKPLDVA